MSTISAGTTSNTALRQTGDTTGALVLQTNGTTTAMTISTAQVVSLTSSLALLGSTSGSVALTAPAVAGTQAYTLPTAQPTANGQALTATTAGVMSWATAGGGGGSPGGSDTQVQYNNAGAFGGISGFTTDGTRVTASTTIGVGGATPSTSGSGITFPATQSASTNANTLDDYEEGSWTPTDGSGAGLTFSTAAGYYTKIGRVVQFSIQVVYPSTADTTPAKIGSFPFVFANDNAARGNSVPSYSTSSLVIGLLNDTGGATAARFYVANGGGNVINVNLSGATIFLSGTYAT